MRQNTVRRRGFISGLLSFGLLVGSAVLAGPAQAATSNGPYYAEPAWDQKLPAATRFIVLLDWSSQAVLDRETGLVWEKAPASGLGFGQRGNWSSGLITCANKTVGGRKGWRLPSMPELASLIDPNASTRPFLLSEHPFTSVLPTFYWSATTTAFSPENAWGVNFDSGDVENRNKIAIDVFNIGFPFWCVRGGMNAEAY